MSLLCPNQNDQKIIQLTRKNTSLRNQLQNCQNYVAQMHNDIIILTELLELEQQRVQQLQEEVTRLKKN